MSTNHHTPYIAGTTQFIAVQMNAPLGELDAALTTFSGELRTTVGNLTALSGEYQAHNHDNRYYTKVNLQTSGEAQVHWGNVSGVPLVTTVGNPGADTNIPTEQAVREAIAAAGPTTFTGLTDTPAAYTDQGGKILAVNEGGTGVEFIAATTAGKALIDDEDAAAQRSTLGLGDAATKSVGTSAGTVAAGDDARFHDHDSDPYDIVGYFPGVPTAGQLLFVMRFARAVTLPTSLTGSKSDLQVAATAETVFSLEKGGEEFGTITFAAAGTVGTFASAAGASFAIGDILTIYGPATADATAAGLSWTIIGTR